MYRDKNFVIHICMLTYTKTYTNLCVYTTLSSNFKKLYRALVEIAESYSKHFLGSSFMISFTLEFKKYTALCLHIRNQLGHLNEK